jgi:hypothetical protein
MILGAATEYGYIQQGDKNIHTYQQRMNKTSLLVAFRLCILALPEFGDI